MNNYALRITHVEPIPLQQTLLEWYRLNMRDLPWRHTNDPYHVLVAEIMLQQTQVERVLPKYREFLEAFPSVAVLAAAPRAEVIRRWSPLGYNLRAVRLHEIAQQVAQQHGGRFPDTVEALQRLKGVGPYTAGAIACFAFRQRVAFLDTNVRRVIARIFLGMPYPQPAQDKQVQAAAEAALPEDAYTWHQALMDLGATVCSWGRPACQRCPVALQCLARPAMDSGGEASARMVAEPRPVYRTQPKFDGSSRYYRGRIVDALRELGPGEAMELSTLAQRVRPHLGLENDDPAWLAALVQRLAADGLVRLDQRGGTPAEWTVALP